jgi:hypothetical protein
MGVLSGVLLKEDSVLQVISVYPVRELESLVQHRFVLYHQFDLA